MQAKEAAYTAGISLVITTLVAIGGHLLGYFGQKEETGAKMIDVALGVLREQPQADQVAGAREWAIGVLDHYSSSAPLPDKMKSELLTKPLLVKPAAADK